MKIKFINQTLVNVDDIAKVVYILHTPVKSYTVYVDGVNLKESIRLNNLGFMVHPDVVKQTTSVDISVIYTNGGVASSNGLCIDELEDLLPVKVDTIALPKNNPLLRYNTNTLHPNTPEGRQTVLSIVDHMYSTVMETPADIVHGNDNLVYYSVFGQGYYNLLKLSLTSIDTYVTDKSFDVLIITDTATKRRITSSAFAKKFNIHYMIVDTPVDGVEASKTKCRLFEWEKINNYNKILFLDADIIAVDNISGIFDEPYESGSIYTVYNTAMNNSIASNSIYYCVTKATSDELTNYISNGQKPFNAGQFLFVNSYKMQQHFANVLWFMENWPGGYFFEQSFMNQYFCRNNLTKIDVLQKYIRIQLITPSKYDPPDNESITPLIHFAGAALNAGAKVEYLTNYIANNASIV